MTNLYEWQVEVAKAIAQLTQEVHALNPGIHYDFNISTVLAPLEGEPSLQSTGHLNAEGKVKEERT